MADEKKYFAWPSQAFATKIVCPVFADIVRCRGIFHLHQNLIPQSEQSRDKLIRQSHMHFVDVSDIHAFTKRVSPALSIRSALQRVKHDDALEECCNRFLCGTIYQSHKKVCQTQTSTCRDEILKNQPNKTGTTPQYFYTIPTSCAILPKLCVCICFLVVCRRGLSCRWKGVPWVCCA